MVVFIWLTISHDIVRCQPVARIDIGIALLSAWFMGNPEIRRALRLTALYYGVRRLDAVLVPPSSGLSDPS